MHFLDDRSGTSAVEFAVLSPLYLMMLMGLVAYGIYFGASHSIQQITADAARYAVAGLDAAERQAIVNQYVTENASGYPFVDPAKVAVNVHDSGTTQFIVAISYDARDLPIWSLFDSLPLPGTTIAHRSVVRIGGM